MAFFPRISREALPTASGMAYITMVEKGRKSTQNTAFWATLAICADRLMNDRSLPLRGRGVPVQCVTTRSVVTRLPDGLDEALPCRLRKPLPPSTLQPGGKIRLNTPRARA